MVFSYFFQAAMGVGFAFALISIPYIMIYRRLKK